MSRYYEMTVRIKGITEEESESLTDVLNGQWEFEDSFADAEDEFSWCGRDNLCGGEGEEEFTDRVAEAVWKHLKRFVQVTVNAVYLENPPCETHERDEDDYKRFLEMGDGSPA